MIKTYDIEQGTEEWQRLRAGKYTGSNAHKLLKYGARPYSLTESSEFSGNYFTKRGHILEDEAIELYEAITGQKVQHVGFVTNSEFPECGYSPDGLTDEAVIEVKCFNEKKHRAIAGGDIPLTVQAQMHFGMLICGKKLARLIIYNPELDALEALKIIEVASKPAIQTNFKNILKNPKIYEKEVYI